MGITEERTRREIASSVGRIGSLGGKYLFGRVFIERADICNEPIFGSGGQREVETGQSDKQSYRGK